MSESNGATAEVKAPLSPVERAEALIARAQERVAERQRASGRPAVESGTETPSDAPAVTPAIERADVLLDQTGEKIGRLATILSQQIRKAGALLREEAEDMVAEAQAIRTKQP